jgi:hypothetical protein
LSSCCTTMLLFSTHLTLASIDSHMVTIDH